jgi:mRNA-degrading endonuclease YafQ of YafQ-DinJ toxin-antitoxin module
MRGSGDLDREVFQEFVQALSELDRLPLEWNEHPLTREWTGFWDAHLADDVVVLFKRVGTEVRLVDIGKHEDFFLNYRRSAAQEGRPPGQTGRERNQSLRNARKEKEKSKAIWGRWPKQSG